MTGGENIEYKIKVSKKARRMRIAVYCDGSVMVTVPRNFSGNLLNKFIAEKKCWIVEKVANFLKSPVKPVRKSVRGEFKKYKSEAKALVEERVAHFNQFYDLKHNKINIKNQKSRWGSCSRKGNLNFNYRILFLTPELRDYIVVHELCHLKEFNHSKNFWNLVAEQVPDYKGIRKQIKLY